MAKNAAEFTQELMDAAGISDADQKKQLEAIFNNDKVKAKVQNVFSDIESANGRATKATSEAQRVYEENLKIFANNKTAVEQAQAKVQSYVEKFGELPGGGDPNDPKAVKAAVTGAIDEKVLNERLGKSEAQTIGLVKIASKITATHLKDFNEVPDFDAIEKIATEQGLSAEKAYQEYRKPKDDERSKAANEAALKKAREEGEIEGRSKIAASTVSDPERSSPFMANLRKSGEVKEGPKDSFIKGWRESAQPKAGGAA